MRKHYRIRRNKYCADVLRLERWTFPWGWEKVDERATTWIFTPGKHLSPAEQEAQVIEALKAKAREDAFKDPRLGEVLCTFIL